jgi:hypothetical protein
VLDEDMFDGSKGVSTIMTTSKNRVKPSPTTDLWRLKGAFNTGIVLDTYMAVDTVQRTLARSQDHHHFRPLWRQLGLPRAVRAHQASRKVRRGSQAQEAAHVQEARQIHRYLNL